MRRCVNKNLTYSLERSRATFGFSYITSNETLNAQCPNPGHSYIQDQALTGAHLSYGRDSEWHK